MTLDDPDVVRAEYASEDVGSSIAHKHLVDAVPELTEQLVVTRRCTVFVAETAVSGRRTP